MGEGGGSRGVHGGLLVGPEVVGPGVHVGGVQPSRVQHKRIESSWVSVSVTWREKKNKEIVNNCPSQERKFRGQDYESRLDYLFDPQMRDQRLVGFNGS